MVAASIDTCKQRPRIPFTVMATSLDTPKIIAALMRDQGYANPQDLAAASGLPYNTLYRWSTGKSNPHKRSLIRLFEALGIDAADYGVVVPGPAPASGPAANTDLGQTLEK